MVRDKLQEQMINLRISLNFHIVFPRLLNKQTESDKIKTHHLKSTPRIAIEQGLFRNPRPKTDDSFHVNA